MPRAAQNVSYPEEGRTDSVRTGLEREAEAACVPPQQGSELSPWCYEPVPGWIRGLGKLSVAADVQPSTSATGATGGAAIQVK